MFYINFPAAPKTNYFCKFSKIIALRVTARNEKRVSLRVPTR